MVRASTGSAERDYYITGDGVTYLLHAPGRRVVISDTGSGMPEIEYITQRGPYQHGESLKDFFLRPRIVELHIRQNFCSRQEYWNGRAAILDLLRPNRNQGVLRKVLPDGSMRDLTVTVQSGPKFEPRKTDSWDEWSLEEVLRFIAYNPVYFDPDQRSQVFGTTGALTFPLTFPITFASFGNTVTVNYEGNWIEYPTLVITGPLTATEIKNETTGEVISFAYAIPAGRSVIVDLSYGSKRITLDDGTNLIGSVSTNSDLSTFHLEPGDNVIRVLGSASDTSTSISVNWFNRYVGI